MSLMHLLVLLIVGALAGLIGERLVGRGMPYGLVGAIVAGLVGAWLMVDVLHVVIAPELSVAGIPLISAILGAAIVVLIVSVGRRDRRSDRELRRGPEQLRLPAPGRPLLKLEVRQDPAPRSRVFFLAN